MTKKKATAPVENEPVVVRKRVDLEKEFGATVKTMLIAVVAQRAGELALGNVGVVITPVTRAHITTAQRHVEAMLTQERSACLAIMDRLIPDAAVQENIRAAVATERGPLMAMTAWKCEWTLAE